VCIVPDTCGAYAVLNNEVRTTIRSCLQIVSLKHSGTDVNEDNSGLAALLQMKPDRTRHVT